MTNKSRPNALVFREVMTAVPSIVNKLFNDDAERPHIKATSVNSREGVRKIFKERGDSTQTMLPVFACKLVQLGVMQEGAANQFVFNKHGAMLGKGDDGAYYKFYGKQVLMQYQITLFTNSYDDIIDVAAMLLLMKPEVSQEMKIDPGLVFPVKIVFDSASGFSIPEISQEAEITKFEFELPGVQISTFVGRIELVSHTQKVVLGGGPLHIDENGRKIVVDRTTFQNEIKVSE